MFGTGVYFNQEFLLSEFRAEHKRLAYKLLDFMRDIGGFSVSFYWVGFLIVARFRDVDFVTDLVKKLYRVEDQKSLNSFFNEQ